MMLAEIKPYWRNPRKNETAVKAVMNSILRYGYLQPIVVDPENVIITGHTRFRALLHLGYQEINVIQADLPADRVKEYRIIDNKTAELASWDLQNLIPELREIPELSDLTNIFDQFGLDKIVGDSLASVEFNSVTNEQVADESQRMKDQFSAGVSKDDFVDVPCPHCGHTISLEKRTLGLL